MTGQTDTPSTRPPATTAPTVPVSGGAVRGPLGRIVAGFLAAGLVVAAALAAAPFVSADEDGVTGAVLLGFAAGWAMLAGLSTRFTTSPQRWAAVPAAFTGLGGTLLLAFGSSVRPVLDWVWPVAALLLVAWLARRVRRLPTRGGRVVLWPVVAMLVVASVGAGYQTVGAAADARTAMPGRLVDVGGYRLHLVCSGAGSPTVVLEPGAGGTSADLAWIAPAVARTTRVCAYDRAGRGWSDPTDAPQNGARVADDLHSLLHRAGIPGPYVLAGHSFGGLYVETFAARYPDEVAGMVLVDSTAPTTAPAAGRDVTEAGVLRRLSGLLAALSRLGVGRLYAHLATGDLPPQARADAIVAASRPSTAASTVDEYAMGSASMQDAAALTDLGDKPLAVLTAGEGSSATWFAAQDRLASLSTHTVHRVVDGARHADLVGDERYAAVTAQAITDVVAAVRAVR